MIEMTDSKKENVIVQMSDIHEGEAEFVPSLLTRCVDEINELKPYIVIIIHNRKKGGLCLVHEKARSTQSCRDRTASPYRVPFLQPSLD